MSNPSYDTVADVVKIVSSQRLLWWLAPVTPISPSESDIISRIEKQVQRQDDAHPCVPFIGKDEQESDGTKSSRADTLRAVFPDVKVGATVIPFTCVAAVEIVPERNFDTADTGAQL
jgi:hypothetical protein